MTSWLSSFRSTRVALVFVCAFLAPLAQAAPGKLLHSERSLYREVLVYETPPLDRAVEEPAVKK